MSPVQVEAMATMTRGHLIWMKSTLRRNHVTVDGKRNCSRWVRSVVPLSWLRSSSAGGATVTTKMLSPGDIAGLILEVTV